MKERVCQELSEIADVAGKYLKCFAFATKEKLNCVTDLKSIKKGLQHCCDLLIGSKSIVQNAQAHRYHNYVVVFLSLEANLSDDSEFGLAFAKKCMSNVELKRNVICGVSDTLLARDGDLAVRQALAAACYASVTKHKILVWSALGKHAFEVAAGQDRLFSLTSKAYKKVLSDTDSEMCATAEAFVKCGGNISTTSDLLYQHPNTIRYRLKKVREKLDMSDISDRELLVLLTLIWLGSGER